MTEQQAHYLLLYTGITAAAIALLAVAFGVLAFMLAVLMKRVNALARELQPRVGPLLGNMQVITSKVADISKTAHEVTADAAPKLRRVTDNLAESSDVYRAKVAQLDTLITDTTDRARNHVDRVDSFMTSTMDRTQDAVHGTLDRAHDLVESVQHAVWTPVRQISGILSGTRAGLETLLHNFSLKEKPAPKPVAFEGESVYTGLEDDYHA